MNKTPRYKFAIRSLSSNKEPIQVEIILGSISDEFIKEFSPKQTDITPQLNSQARSELDKLKNSRVLVVNYTRIAGHFYYLARQICKIVITAQKQPEKFAKFWENSGPGTGSASIEGLSVLDVNIQSVPDPQHQTTTPSQESADSSISTGTVLEQTNKSMPDLFSEDQLKQLADYMAKLNQQTQANANNKEKADEPKAFDLESELICISKKTEEQFFSLHKWAKYILINSRTLTKIPKELSSIDDETIVKSMITFIRKGATVVEEDKEKLKTYKNRLCYIIEKIPFSSMEIFRQNSNGSILAKVVHNLDCNSKVGNILSEGEIMQLINDIRYDAQSGIGANFTQSKSSTGKRVRSATVGSTNDGNICRNFNTTKGCNYPACRYDHHCSKHYKKDGSRHDHPATSCNLE